MAAPSTLTPPGSRPAVQAGQRAIRGTARTGHLVEFFGRVLVALPTMWPRFRHEMLRHLADITWGNGSIVVGGGTLNVAAVLGITAGALVAVEGFNAMNLLGLGPATGLVSSFATTRELAPVMIAMAFIAQAGCRFTAQLGAMRINDEIDAMESLSINPVPYLVSTRVVASIIAVVPLFLAALALAYVACQLVSVVAGQSSGSYLHYFSMFLEPRDVIYATIKSVVFVFISSTIQCYYGFFASGGPAGVGVAAGRAMRASVTTVVVVNMLLTMALWGVVSGARFGG
ncbi:ABC transporter permease [Mycobacterium sp. CBMA293]|uniref:MlaE family ABC transporter permease n=2 Tax=unclassified Mycolicibacterium TaxID=2636767 RepID=UPI0012DFADF3|nr:ABC transporter permease [Mycolicibacterium sp. CBMA 360]MUL59405.1 ABC transporter permease [Mycolicibacterium sp. CBMA 335]MUL71130.1 ABC transporter permease [Mycolicibacterium sp. CBMA 311]MUL94773.1 ABC transporter permease [Mycolicibacterium sp. CBMA 230]MUM03614.1 ABC transporter permease [Mycolicibacterium sp. CBMA 213]MUM11893.1 ABC transporter permease [Mycolicibacterium sp. CBMA 293]